jgi:hypothetical protein
MPRIFPALCLILMTTSAVRVSAQVYPYRDGTPGVTGYRSEVIAEVMIQESEFVRLAEAIPADKYTWRPSPDVRTSFSTSRSTLVNKSPTRAPSASSRRGRLIRHGRISSRNRLVSPFCWEVFRT